MSAERRWRFMPTRKNNLRITKILPDKPDEYPYLYRGEEATVCLTKDGSRFRFHVNPDTKVTSQSAFISDVYLNIYRQGTVNQALADRVLDSGPVTDEDQEKTNNFLAQNWDLLFPLLYSGEISHALPTNTFSNVSLGTTVDLIGIGPDGTVFIFDTSPGRKAGRLEEADKILRSALPELEGRTVLLRASYTNESRNPMKLQMRINVSRNPVKAQPRLD